MKIAVLGAGAMGGIVAIGLHRGGYDVTIIDPWKPHVDAVRTTGFQMTGFYAQQPVEWRGVIPALHTDELDQLHDKLDVVFVSVKGYNTRRCVELIRPFLAEDGMVVSVQNGINEPYHRRGRRPRTHHRLRDHDVRARCGSPGHPSHPGRKTRSYGLHTGEYAGGLPDRPR